MGIWCRCSMRAGCVRSFLSATRIAFVIYTKCLACLLPYVLVCCGAYVEQSRQTTPLVRGVSFDTSVRLEWGAVRLRPSLTRSSTCNACRSCNLGCLSCPRPPRPLASVLEDTGIPLAKRLTKRHVSVLLMSYEPSDIAPSMVYRLSGVNAAPKRWRSLSLPCSLLLVCAYVPVSRDRLDFACADRGRPRCRLSLR